MQFKKFESKYILRLDKGEEIVVTLKKFCIEQGIKLGSIQGIGAINKATLALYAPEEKKYYTKELNADYEIAPLIGNVTTMNKEIYLHIHINLGDKNFNSFSGHLKEAFVSATCEIIINTINGEVDREFSEEIGLNLLKLD